MKKTLMTLAAAASVTALPVLAQQTGETTGAPATGQQMQGQPMQGQQQPGQQQQAQPGQQQAQPGQQQAQQMQRDQQPMQGQQAQAQQQQQDLAMQGRRAVIGEITDMRQVNVEGAEAPHRLVVLQNPQKERLVVDLGVLDNQQAQQYQKGDRIIAIGKEARINGDPVLHARYVGELQPVGKLTPPERGQAS